jgi:hypothetical protein
MLQYNPVEESSVNDSLVMLERKSKKHTSDKKQVLVELCSSFREVTGVPCDCTDPTIEAIGLNLTG